LAAKNKTVTLIPGDGIGVEVTNCVVELFGAAKIPVNWEFYNITRANKNQLLSEELLQSVKKNKVILAGPLLTPIGIATHQSVDKILAHQFDLYSYVTHIKSPPVPEHVPITYRDIDFVVVRENTEAEYSGLEHEVTPGVVESLKVVTRRSCERIARYAFEEASKKWGSKVIAVHKANIMKQADGLFLKVCQEMSAEFPDVGFEDLIIDNCAMQLVNYPHKFKNSVVVTTNLYGSIVANTAAGLCGGAAVTGGYCIGDKYALFAQQPRHVAMDIAGKGIANPIGIIRASYYMLRHLGMHNETELIKSALYRVLNEGSALTKDLGGSATTKQFMDALGSNLDHKK
jgi:isocitrate dehydrogenase (NAD+)